MFISYKVQKKTFLRSTILYAVYYVTHIKHFFWSVGFFPPTILDFQTTKCRDYISDVHEYFTHINLFSNGKTNYFQLFIFTSFPLLLRSIAISPQLCFCREQLRTAMSLHKMVQVSCTAKTHIPESYPRNKSSCQSCSFMGKKNPRHADETTATSLVKNKEYFTLLGWLQYFLFLPLGGEWACML